MMYLITQVITSNSESKKRIPLKVDRHKLARRRWRGKAENGEDFGFDLVDPLSHGDCIYEVDTHLYYIEQTPEPCFLIPLADLKKTALIGWMIGNLHFKAAFSEKGIFVQDDLAVKQLLKRENIAYDRVMRIFQPYKQSGHSHNYSDHIHSHTHD